MDIVEQINAVHRQVTGEPGGRSVLLRRTCPATPEEWERSAQAREFMTLSVPS